MLEAHKSHNEYRRCFSRGPKTVGSLFSAESKDAAFIRAMAPGLLDSEVLVFQTLEHVMRVSRTWDSIISLLPKGGETIWGNKDWSPEEDCVCDSSKKRHPPQFETKGNSTDGQNIFQVPESTNYGRIILFWEVSIRVAFIRAHYQWFSDCPMHRIWRFTVSVE